MGTWEARPGEERGTGHGGGEGRPGQAAAGAQQTRADVARAGVGSMCGRGQRCAGLALSRHSTVGKDRAPCSGRQCSRTGPPATARRQRRGRGDHGPAWGERHACAWQDGAANTQRVCTTLFRDGEDTCCPASRTHCSPTLQLAVTRQNERALLDALTVRSESLPSGSADPARRCGRGLGAKEGWLRGRAGTVLVEDRSSDEPWRAAGGKARGHAPSIGLVAEALARKGGRQPEPRALAQSGRG